MRFLPEYKKLALEVLYVGLQKKVLKHVSQQKKLYYVRAELVSTNKKKYSVRVRIE